MKKQAFTSGLSDTGILLIIGAGVAIFNILTNGQYGFHRDELDIIMNARRLAWGYVAYPPLTPFLARLELMLFGPSLIGMRAAVALAHGAAVVLTGLMARDFGGGRLAQITAALAVAISPMGLVVATMIQYMAFDYLCWVLLAFFTIRLLHSEDPRWWVGIGAAIGLGMMTKFAILFFVAGLAAGILLTPNRRYLRSRWLWIGAAISLLIYLPNLIWQIQHNFISLQFTASIHERDVSIGRAEEFLLNQLISNSNPLVLPLWLLGLYFCAFSAGGKKFRAIAWMFLATFVLLIISQGRPFYLMPAYPMLAAAGAVPLENWLQRLSSAAQRRVQIGMAATWIVGAVIAVLLVKPVTPIHSPVFDIAADANAIFVEMIGWQELVQDIANVYARIPQDERPATAVLAENYGIAGALELYGAGRDLPPMISGSNSLWERGYGNPEPQTVIATGFDQPDIESLFKTCKIEGAFTNSQQVENEESFSPYIFVCRQPRQPWPELWQSMRWFQ